MSCLAVAMTLSLVAWCCKGRIDVVFRINSPHGLDEISGAGVAVRLAISPSCDGATYAYVHVHTNEGEG